MRLGYRLKKQRSEVFRMAKQATGIDPESILSEREIEALIGWMVAMTEKINETT
jgi:hypothetical protein